MDINTERLKIRNFAADDFRDVQEIIISKESSEYAVYDHQFPTSHDEVNKLTDRFVKNSGFLAVCLLSDNKVIGYVCLHGEGKELDLGYCFNSAYEGSGYATEACIAVINYMFNTLHVEKLISSTALLNYPSCRLLERLGFSKTGECTCSFRKDPEGNPIEFVGGDFLLEKSTWMKMDYSK